MFLSPHATLEFLKASKRKIIFLGSDPFKSFDYPLFFSVDTHYFFFFKTHCSRWLYPLYLLFDGKIWGYPFFTWVHLVVDWDFNQIVNVFLFCFSCMSPFFSQNLKCHLDFKLHYMYSCMRSFALNVYILEVIVQYWRKFRHSLKLNAFLSSPVMI